MADTQRVMRPIAIPKLDCHARDYGWHAEHEAAPDRVEIIR